MNLLEYLDRAGQRRLERELVYPRRPLNINGLIGVSFLAGYYLMVYALIRLDAPIANEGPVRDAMLVLGPAVGAIIQSLFRSDVKDEIAASNTGSAFRAMGKQAEATKAAAETMPASVERAAGAAADKVAGEAATAADAVAADATQAEADLAAAATQAAGVVADAAADAASDVKGTPHE